MPFLVTPVESNKDGKDISHMSLQAFEQLQELRTKTSFVPVTARKWDEIMRISFIEQDLPKWMICESGRVIYQEGERHTKWDLFQSQLLDQYRKHIKECQQWFFYLLQEKFGVKAWHINKDMVMARTDKLTDEQVALLKEYENWFRKRGCILYTQQRKAYLIPQTITKGNAIRYLIELLQPRLTVSAGDSDMDASMFKETDYAIIPKHHTVQQPIGFVTTEEGMKAGEQILWFAQQKLCR